MPMSPGNLLLYSSWYFSFTKKAKVKKNKKEVIQEPDFYSYLAEATLLAISFFHLFDEDSARI